MDKEKALTEYLIEKYNASAIVLFGSRTEADVHEKTDWDLFVFTDKTEDDLEDFAELREWNGELLEVTPISTKEMEREDFILDTAMHPLKEWSILHDNTNGKLAEICKRTKQARDAGPKALTDRQKDLAIKILTKYIRKVESRGSQPEIVYFAASQFFIYAIRYWFQYRQQWPEPIHQALSTIKREDPEYEKLLRKLFEEKVSSDVVLLQTIKDIREKLQSR